MTRLFLTVFLWLWLTVLAVAVIFVTVVTRAGRGYHYMLSVSLHNLGFFLVVGAIYCYFVSRHLVTPLNKLGAAAANIAEGRLETRTDPSLRKRRDEIADLARNFDHMADRIEVLVTGQRRLLGDVSHELRSPLARLIVALGLAKRGPSEEAAENLERIGLEAHRLDALIGQLLTLTRIDSGVDRADRKPFALADLVQEIASDADFEARARGCSVTLAHADACMIDGLEEALRSAIENVVRNAVRHTAPGSTAAISLRASGSRALLEVRDHGPGVPESIIPTIFQPFRRVPGDSSEGAGLGLAIAERAVQVHGGSIRARNAPDGGLIVGIDLPLKP